MPTFQIQWKLIALVFVLQVTAICQPVISPKGVLNTAGFTPSDLPGGAVAAGSMITIIGQGLGPSTAVTASSAQLDTNLAGVTVQVTQNDQVTFAYPVYVSDTRIRAILPGNTPPGASGIQVSFDDGSGNAGTSDPSAVTIVASQLGLFGAADLDLSTSAAGVLIPAQDPSAYGAALVSTTDANGNPTTVTPSASVIATQNVTLWATGAGDGSDPITVWIGGMQATNVAVFPSVYPGVDNIQFSIPPGAPQGCAVPVQAQTASGAVSNTMTVAISATGGQCQDVPPALNSFEQTTGNVGLIMLLRTQIAGFFANFYFAGFYSNDPTALPAPQGLVLPPAGTCAQASGSGSLFSSQFLHTVAGRLTTLDAGFPSAGTFADSDTFPVINFQGPGGADIGPFVLTTQPPPPVIWMNPEIFGITPLGTDMTLTWNVSPLNASHRMLVMGYSYNRDTDSSGFFLCTANASDAQFTVPGYITSRLPATPASALPIDGALMIANVDADQPVSFSATGLAAGFAYPMAGAAIPVVFQ